MRLNVGGAVRRLSHILISGVLDHHLSIRDMFVENMHLLIFPAFGALIA